VVVGWAVERVAVQGVGFLVEWAAVDSVRAVAAVAAVEEDSVVPDQRVACRARAVAGRGWAAREVVARAVVVSVAARAAAGWAGVVWGMGKTVAVADWEAVAKAVAVTARPRVHRALLHSQSKPCRLQV